MKNGESKDHLNSYTFPNHYSMGIDYNLLKLKKQLVIINIVLKQ